MNLRGRWLSFVVAGVCTITGACSFAAPNIVPDAHTVSASNENVMTGRSQATSQPAASLSSDDVPSQPHAEEMDGDRFDTQRVLPPESSEGIVPAQPGSGALDYSFLNNYGPLPKSKLLHWLQHNGMPIRAGLLEGRPVFRPFVHWTRWANKRQPFGRAALVLFIAAMVAWIVFPQRLAAAQSECMSRYWRSLGTGMLTVYVPIMLIRFALRTEIGWPLAIVMIGGLQLLLLLGVVVVCAMIGNTFCHYLTLNKWEALSRSPSRLRSAHLLIGALMLSALLQLGSPFGLPPLGTRLVVLLAMAGLGALYRVRGR